LLKSGDAAGLGRLMNISHDGDRVSRSSKNGTWKRTALRLTEGDPEAWGTATEDSANIAELAGSYGCSLPELDRIVDLARRIPGVAGAQLAGAGLGGCIMVLAEKSQMSGILSKLENQGIRGDVFRPIAGACSLVMDR
jgi:N-acetylgalactosamine kinase